MHTFSVSVLVPSARLELAQLSPLPPQDSVSTNFTTKAFLVLGLRYEPDGLCCPNTNRVYPEIAWFLLAGTDLTVSTQDQQVQGP